MKVNNFSGTTTADKVQVGDSTAGTTTSTNYTWTYNPSNSAEKGWECPRCGRINAPWVRQCDCSRGNIDITWAHPYEYDWWNGQCHSYLPSHIACCRPSCQVVHPAVAETRIDLQLR